MPRPASLVGKGGPGLGHSLGHRPETLLCLSTVALLVPIQAQSNVAPLTRSYQFFGSATSCRPCASTSTEYPIQGRGGACTCTATVPCPLEQGQTGQYKIRRARRKGRADPLPLSAIDPSTVGTNPAPQIFSASLSSVVFSFPSRPLRSAVRCREAPSGCCLLELLAIWPFSIVVWLRAVNSVILLFLCLQTCGRSHGVASASLRHRAVEGPPGAWRSSSRHLSCFVR
jgi:hypothetical protein